MSAIELAASLFNLSSEDIALAVADESCVVAFSWLYGPVSNLYNEGSWTMAEWLRRLENALENLSDGHDPGTTGNS